MLTRNMIEASVSGSAGTLWRSVAARSAFSHSASSRDRRQAERGTVSFVLA